MQMALIPLVVLSVASAALNHVTDANARRLGALLSASETRRGKFTGQGHKSTAGLSEGRSACSPGLFVAREVRLSSCRFPARAHLPL